MGYTSFRYDCSAPISLQQGIDFLGLKIFSHHKLLKQKNLRKFYWKLQSLYGEYDQGDITYDTIYDFLEGWCAYARNANTYKLQQRILAAVKKKFPVEISTKVINQVSAQRV